MTNIEDLMADFYRFLDDKYKEIESGNPSSKFLLETKEFAQYLKKKYCIDPRQIAYFMLAAIEHIVPNVSFNKKTLLWEYEIFPYLVANNSGTIAFFGALKNRPQLDVNGQVINLKRDFNEFLKVENIQHFAKEIISNIDPFKQELNSIEELD